MPRRKERPTVRKRMRDMLADGRPHTITELRSCLFDELGPASNIHAHLTGLRKELRPRGETVLCVLYRYRICYQQVRLLQPA